MFTERSKVITWKTRIWWICNLVAIWGCVVVVCPALLLLCLIIGKIVKFYDFNESFQLVCKLRHLYSNILRDRLRCESQTGNVPYLLEKRLTVLSVGATEFHQIYGRLHSSYWSIPRQSSKSNCP